MFSLATLLQQLLLIGYLARRCMYGKPFPLEEFLQTSNEEVLELYRTYNLCFSLRVGFTGCCNCDSKCFKRSNCCADVLWKTKSYANISVYKEDLIKHASRYKYQECLEPFNIFHSSSRYMFVNECENGTLKENNDCRKPANTLNTALPVAGDDGYKYKNIYCAKCNGVKSFTIIPITGSCADQQNHCEHRLGTEWDASYYQCFHIHITNCMPDNKYYHLCRAFLGPINSKTRNYFCSLCAQNSIHSTFTNQGSPCSTGHIPQFPFSWSILLKFKNPSNEKPDNDYCGDKQNSFLPSLRSKKCFFCPDGYRAKQGKCVLKEIKEEDMFTPNASFENCLMRYNVSVSARIFHKCGFGKRLFADPNPFKSVSNFLILENIDQILKDLILLKLKTYTNGVPCNEEVYVGASEYPVEYTQNFDTKHMFPNNRICISPILLHNNVTFDEYCNVQSNQLTFKNSSLSFWIEIRNGTIYKRIYFCEKFYLSKICPLKVISANLTTAKNRTLLYKTQNLNRLYKPDKYVPMKNGRYGVCDGPDLVKQSWLKDIYPVEGYLSITGTSCSIICYILLIVVFIIFKEMRNIPGICVLALSMCLLVGDTLFIMANLLRHSSLNTNVCMAIGILIHCSLVLSQFWGGLLAYDISVKVNFRNFGLKGNRRKTVIVLAVACFVGAVLIVVVGIVLRKYNLIDGSYEEHGVCILHGYYSRIFLYYAPLLGSSTISICVLVKTTFYLHKHKKQSRRIVGKCGHEYCVPELALRIIFICGVSESIGLFKITKLGYSKNNPLADIIVNIIYSTVKSFRGVLLFVAYIGRKHLIHLLKQKIRRMPKGEEKNAIVFLGSIKSTKGKRMEKFQDSAL